MTTREGTEELTDVRAVWDAEAAGFDDEPDHGLHDPATRESWRELLLGALPPAPARVADLGSGTGTLALLLAEQGYVVDGVDLSPEMVRLAVEKAAGDSGVRFTEGDASRPPLEAGAYDAVLCRHVLWALPDPAAALRRWVDLLAPGGRLVLVEGRWFTQGGLTGEQTLALVRGTGRHADLTPLPDPVLWGKEIDDERYLVVS